jgi:hypothetical protein
VLQLIYTDFPHRRNPDGTFDSICKLCFATIATRDTEAELAEAERAHNCQRFDLGKTMHPTDQDRSPNREHPVSRIDSQEG